MLTTRIAIIGGGLAGLHAATLLERQGIAEYVLLEARNRLGGRIESLDLSAAETIAGDAVERFDLGATWFWPEWQPQLAHLVAELGLETFEQDESGDMLIERSAHDSPIRTDGYVSAVPSVRIVGGMRQLIASLEQNLGLERIVFGQKVLSLCQVGQQVEISAADSSGRTCIYRVDQVLMAMPPRLAASLDFMPALPERLKDEWERTPTWMAPHAKYVAVYKEPFWRKQGLSGFARSGAGPLCEIHDASSPGGHAALFGFFGIPAVSRARVPDEIMRQHCRAQLGRLFGKEASVPVLDIIKDWAQEAHTASKEDLNASGEHAVAPSFVIESGAWQGKLFGIASEWSEHFSGYVAGAIEAARQGITELLVRFR